MAWLVGNVDRGKYYLPGGWWTSCQNVATSNQILGESDTDVGGCGAYLEKMTLLSRISCYIVLRSQSLSGKWLVHFLRFYQSKTTRQLSSLHPGDESLGSSRCSAFEVWDAACDILKGPLVTDAERSQYVGLLFGLYEVITKYLARKSVGRRRLPGSSWTSNGRLIAIT